MQYIRTTSRADISSGSIPRRSGLLRFLLFLRRSGPPFSVACHDSTTRAPGVVTLRYPGLILTAAPVPESTAHLGSAGGGSTGAAQHRADMALCMRPLGTQNNCTASCTFIRGLAPKIYPIIILMLAGTGHSGPGNPHPTHATGTH